MHDDLPCVADDLLPSAGMIGTAPRESSRNRYTHRSCNALPRGSGHLHQVCETPRSASQETRRAGSKAPMCRQVFGLADSDLAIHLVPWLPRLAPSALDGTRFHLPLRGSSGFAPDSLLTRPRQHKVLRKRAPTGHKLLCLTDRVNRLFWGFGLAFSDSQKPWAIPAWPAVTAQLYH